MRRDFSYGLRIGRKSWKGLEHCLAPRALPNMTNDLIIHEFRFTRSDNLVIAPNTLDPEHKHRGSLFHRP
jgi:hypothetical protein